MSASEPDSSQEGGPGQVRVAWVDQSESTVPEPSRRLLLIGGLAVLVLVAIIVSALLGRSPTVSPTSSAPSTRSTAVAASDSSETSGAEPSGDVTSGSGPGSNATVSNTDGPGARTSAATEV